MDFSLSIGAIVSIFIAICLASLGFMLFLSWAIRPLRERPRAQQTYECGMPAQGDAREVGFNYLQYAGLFLVFDVAALYLFLYAISRGLPLMVHVSFMLGILTLGLMIVYGTRSRRYYAT
jgi:NADH:ubiquinone oxidoreductase subunit 3 (subunit A)